MLNVKNSINHLIAQRSQLWSKYEQALEQNHYLRENVGPEFDHSQSAGAIAPLTATQCPDEEVEAVIQQLEQVDKKITSLQSLIHADKAAIAQLRFQSRMLMIGSALLGILLCGGLVLYWQHLSKPQLNIKFQSTVLRE